MFVYVCLCLFMFVCWFVMLFVVVFLLCVLLLRVRHFNSLEWTNEIHNVALPFLKYKLEDEATKRQKCKKLLESDQKNTVEK